MDLTTLARAKAYLTGTSGNTPGDDLVSGMISRASDAAMQYTGRNFQRSTFASLRLNGSGTCRRMMPANPIISVSALSVDGTPYQASPDGLQTGYQFDEKFLYLFNAEFCRGLRNVVVSFVAGFTTSQTGFIPANPGPYTITPVTGSGLGADGSPAQTSGPAAVDQGVSFVGGAALTLVTGVPAAGQYAFSGGVYTFAAADTGKQVTMSYDYVPGSVEQAVLELIGTWYAKRGNFGVNSKMLAGETVTFLDKDLPSSVKGLLQPYRFVVSP